MSEPTTLASPTDDFSTPPFDKDVLYEVIDGSVVEKPRSAFELWNMAWLLRLLNLSDMISQAGLVAPEMLFQLDPARNLQRRPDLAFLSFAKWPRRRPFPMVEAWEMVPEMAIEVVSKAETFDGVLDRVNDYFRAGVRLVWMVMPVQKLVYIYRSPTDVRILQPGDDLDGGDVVPNFRLPVRDLFTGYENGGGGAA